MSDTLNLYVTWFNSYLRCRLQDRFANHSDPVRDPTKYVCKAVYSALQSFLGLSVGPKLKFQRFFFKLIKLLRNTCIMMCQNWISWGSNHVKVRNALAIIDDGDCIICSITWSSWSSSIAVGPIISDWDGAVLSQWSPVFKWRGLGACLFRLHHLVKTNVLMWYDK